MGVFDTEEKASEYYQTFALKHGRSIESINPTQSTCPTTDTNCSFSTMDDRDCNSLPHTSNDPFEAKNSTSYSTELRIALGKAIHAEAVVTLALHENLCEGSETLEILQLRQHLLSRKKVLSDCHKSLLGFIFSLDSSPANTNAHYLGPTHSS